MKIGHVISLISCQNEARVKGFLDALMVLRHSIHQNSVHNPESGSKYSYQMYAVVHSDSSCVAHLSLLKRLGYTPLVKSTPVNVSAISNEWYRTHVEGENCCGSAEFIKLYAYTLVQHPIVVHWDLDVAVLQPMDVLYDAMLFEATSKVGKRARERLQLQHPQLKDALPQKIDAFFTRDVTSAQPWEPVQAVQGGFVVARPNVSHFEMYQNFIMEGNYSPGRGPQSGWGGLGYGGFQGAMAYQGVLAYFYDIVYPNHAVELDVCRWNQVVADVIWRGPNRMEHAGQCRDHPEDGNFEENTPENSRCEDCRSVPITEVKTVHYTACKKPWECALPYPRVPGARRKAHTYRLRELTNVTTCGLLFSEYFQLRRHVEKLITDKGGFEKRNYEGSYHPEYFLGYCRRQGNYISMEEVSKEFDMKAVYGF